MKIRFFVVLIILVLLLQGSSFASIDINQISNDYYSKDETYTFIGHNSDWGIRNWVVDVNYGINVQTFGIDKGISYHNFNAISTWPQPDFIGNGSFTMTGVNVYEGSKILRTHHLNSFYWKSIWSDPNWIVWMSYEKDSSDVIDASSSGQVVANFMYINPDFYPLNNWSNNKLKIDF